MCDETRWLLQLKDYRGEATAYDKKLIKLCSYSKQAEDHTETTEMRIVFS